MWGHGRTLHFSFPQLLLNGFVGQAYGCGSEGDDCSSDIQHMSSKCLVKKRFSHWCKPTTGLNLWMEVDKGLCAELLYFSVFYCRY